MIPVERLKEIPIFAQLDEEELAHLAPLFHRERRKIGDILGKQGEPGDAFYILDSGTLRVRYVNSSGQEEVLGYMTAPKYFGETSLLTGTNRDVTVDVFSLEADLAVLSKSEFDELLASFPRLRDDLAIRSDIQNKLAQRFPWLSEGEIVLVNTRRHWFALVERLIFPGLISLALLIASLAVYLILDPTGADNVFSYAAIALFFLFLLWTAGAGTWHVIDWSNDYYIVTNKRAIHIEKVIFFFEEREEAPIEMITNVIQYREGLWQRLLGFTDFRVETAGKQVDINFTYAPESADISKHIFEQMGRVKDRGGVDKRERQLAAIRDDIRRRLDPNAAEKLGGSKPPPPTHGVPTLGAAAAPPPNPVKRTRWSALGRGLRSKVVSEHEVIWRKHWVVLAENVDEPIVGIIILLAVGLLHVTGIVPLTIIPTDSIVATSALVVVWSILLLFALLWTWYQYEDWSNDVYRITDDRIIDVERSPLGLRQTSRETTLERVQDVSFIQAGMIATFLGYGTLIVETAGAGRIMFFDIGNPKEAIQEIFRRRDAHRAKLQREKQTTERSQFLDWFMEYDRVVRERGGYPPSTPPGDGNTPPTPTTPPSV